jgi:hypothetical protein
MKSEANIDKALIQREAAMQKLRNAENYGSVQEYYDALGEFNAACDAVRDLLAAPSDSPRGKQSF